MRATIQSAKNPYFPLLTRDYMFTPTLRYIPPARLGVAVTLAPAPIPAERLGVMPGPNTFGVRATADFRFSSSSSRASLGAKI